jgi:twinkle protein
MDPWNELEHERPSHMNETDYISDCLSKIRHFCKRHNIHIWVVAHPTKLQKATTKEGKEQYPVPTPYDVSGSSHWRNKAFNCLSIYRDPASSDNTVEIHVQKIKYKKNGRVGKATLFYDRLTGRYSDPVVYAS